jgi:hypothetical protein
MHHERVLGVDDGTSVQHRLDATGVRFEVHDVGG